MRVVAQTSFVPGRITIVDDIITKGATLIAAATLVQQRFPGAQVRAFAMVRTKGYEPEVGAIMEPVVGEVACVGGEASRTR